MKEARRRRRRSRKDRRVVLWKEREQENGEVEEKLEGKEEIKGRVGRKKGGEKEV